MNKPEILIVDDEPINLTVLRELLKSSYQVRACKSGEEAIRIASRSPKPDLILMDIVMPEMDGYEALRLLRSNPATNDIPVIYVSSLDSIIDEEKGFRLGAVDYITKPFRPAIVRERVRVHLELKQVRDILKNKNQWLEDEVNRRVHENQLIQDISLSIILQMAETRDTDTVYHTLRTRSYVGVLGKKLQQIQKFREALSDAKLNNIIKASSLHDIGKIGIPDAILLKPGKLTPEEFDIMKTHSRIGGDAIRSAINNALQIYMEQNVDGGPTAMAYLEEAEKIARYHHERWDGSGYPEGLKGEEIPLSARLMAVADVFDALTSPRIYKEPWDFEEAIGHIREQRGLHFDPDVVDALVGEMDQFRDIFKMMGEKA